MIRVECPHCHRRYRTEREAFGRTAVCTGCSQAFRIGEALAQFQWKQTDLAEDSWIGVEAPVEKKELKHCIICDAPLEPGSIVCTACGANQVTGVVHRPKTEPQTERRPIGSVIPLRAVLLLAVLGAIGIGGYYAILAITRSATSVTDELLDQNIVGQGARFLREGGDEYAFAERFSGRVTQENLSRFVRMLRGADANIRLSAALMIGAGQVSDVTPLIDSEALQSNAEDVRRALHAIGARRLVELSTHADDRVRTAAARAMCLLCGLPPESDVAEELARPAAIDARIARWNQACRAWPEATGGFSVTIGEKAAPFGVEVQQVGRTFYLRVGRFEFHSVWTGDEPPPLPRFAIPVSRWAAATGATLNVTSIEELVGGTVTLGSPNGVGWEGTVRVNGRQDFPGTLEGFLPLSAPGRGETSTAPIRLQRR